MGMLTEREIFSCMRENFAGAAQDCRLLAKLPAQGPAYKRMRERLKLIEGCCRQAGHWREDARWFSLGLVMEEAHQRAGNWIRRKWPRPLFLKLADNLEAGAKIAAELETKATGRIGMILPKPLPGPHRETRPVSIILP